ncbi:hypothetical protein DPEC_G00089060 [Dallia pectoralis]|uniref:Uncharacterized protein n=1 Tax=Dallia pectoralis TaxID=75939 RepID=A0ACC2H1B7_DALPE|nr:hypothetical protein DPEC_G00089060 [Dallia pectoralis]
MDLIISVLGLLTLSLGGIRCQGVYVGLTRALAANAADSSASSELAINRRRHPEPREGRPTDGFNRDGWQ